jgi:ubiquinone/menaquinone biosynthesis C-methylase UbiE
MPSGTGLVVGIDHALPMLVEAQKRIAGTGIRVNYLRASAQALPIASEAAASIVIGGSLNEIGNLAACLAEVRRILTSNGRFVTMTLTMHPNQFQYTIQRLLAPSGIQFWPTHELIAQFEMAGLPVEAQFPVGIVLFTRSLVGV